MKRAPLALPLALACVQALLLGRTAWDKSDTIDEPVYIATAVHQWTAVLGGDAAQAFERNCESPALPKWGFGLGLRLADPRLFAAWASRGDEKEPDPLGPPIARIRRNLLAARLATIAVVVLAGLALWSAARRFGEDAAVLTHALWCLSPTVLAQGSLATLDGWAAALCALSLWAGLRFSDRPGLGRAAALGALIALAAACKVTALGLLPIGIGLTAVASRRKTGRPAIAASLKAAGVLLSAFLLALWAVYAFTVGDIHTDALCGTTESLGFRASLPLPFPAWIEGLLRQGLHGEEGHLSYLFGQVSSDGWWWFYLACLALKTTLGAQFLGLLAATATLVARAARRTLLGDAALLAFPALLLVLMSLGNTQNGIRYVLPLFPFVMLWAGRTLPRIVQAFGPRGRLVAFALLGIGALESLAVHPDSLMFFNVWAGGPRGGPRYLIHGDDWGQDQRNLAEYVKRLRPWKLYYTLYNGNPARWGLDWERAPCTPAPGYYALQAIEVHRPKRMEAGCLDWLTIEPPDDRIGYSIYFYQVTRPRIERLLAERGRVVPFWRSGP
jgi:Dolichyl-phosphate-mannose-protein mannosyltransferase